MFLLISNVFTQFLSHNGSNIVFLFFLQCQKILCIFHYSKPHNHIAAHFGENPVKSNHPQNMGQGQKAR